MAHYDPNDPRYNQAEEMARTTAEPHRPRTDPTADSTGYDQNTYVEPVAGRASPVPLIIGVLAALALAYFVLDRFMTREAEQAEPAVTTSQPAPVEPAPVEPAPVEPTPGETVEGAMQDAGRSLEQGAAETGAAVDNALGEAGAALEGAAQATGDAVQDAATAIGEAAQNAADAISEGVDNTTTQPAPAPSN